MINEAKQVTRLREPKDEMLEWRVEIDWINWKGILRHEKIGMTRDIPNEYEAIRAALGHLMRKTGWKMPPKIERAVARRKMDIPEFRDKLIQNRPQMTTLERVASEFATKGTP